MSLISVINSLYIFKAQAYSKFIRKAISSCTLNTYTSKHYQTNLLKNDRITEVKDLHTPSVTMVPYKTTRRLSTEFHGQCPFKDHKITCLDLNLRVAQTVEGRYIQFRGEKIKLHFLGQTSHYHKDSQHGFISKQQKKKKVYSTFKN